MIFHRCIGGVYELYFEDVKLRFLVHRNLIDENTRNMILKYLFTGTLPKTIFAEATGQVISFLPITCNQDDRHVMENIQYSELLWFVL